MTKHKATKITDEFSGDTVGYTYRGIDIERRDHVPSGFYGAWTFKRAGSCRESCPTLKDAKATIDRRLSQAVAII